MAKCIKCGKTLTFWERFNTCPNEGKYHCPKCSDPVNDPVNKDKCGLCGKKFGIFDTKTNYRTKGGKRIYVCNNCDIEQEAKKEGLIMENEKNKEQLIAKIEYKRKCKACKKVWHCLKSQEISIESEIKRTQSSIKVAGLGMMAGNWSALGASEQAKRNIAALSEKLDKLRTCPKCGSHSYIEEEVSY
ncbi:MAG: hypothetical protein PHO02_01045 [Candidatus Nanoarchaeia archaeon]|nr:hypothetical protein [Candidatus Nanoarchaeia archaeon]